MRMKTGIKAALCALLALFAAVSLAAVLGDLGVLPGRASAPAESRVEALAGGAAPGERPLFWENDAP